MQVLIFKKEMRVKGREEKRRERKKREEQRKGSIVIPFLFQTLPALCHNHSCTCTVTF